mmetsp:Transcript_5114/g.6772  ORF Transcript_5114/g.6772 Transcript_5114/m.6772 type:complete len:84 (-) Transcript_5114:675-926(-)
MIRKKIYLDLVIFRNRRTVTQKKPEEFDFRTIAKSLQVDGLITNLGPAQSIPQGRKSLDNPAFCVYISIEYLLDGYLNLVNTI